MNGTGIDILTPEHVAIRLVPAGLGSRFIAWAVDCMCIVGISLLFWALALSLATVSMALSSVVTTTGVWLILWGYHVLFETLWQGRTPGKVVMRLRVVDDRGLPLNLAQSVARNVVRILDMQPLLFYGFGTLVCLFDSAHRRAGDIAGGTLVVRDRKLERVPAAIAQSRQYNSLRVPRVMRSIRSRITLDEREFLLSLCLRAPELNDRAKFDLMDDVGAYYREKLKIDDPNLSGENLVRGLTAILFEKRGEA